MDLRTRNALKWVCMVRAAASRREDERGDPLRRRREDSRAAMRWMRDETVGVTGGGFS